MIKLIQMKKLIEFTKKMKVKKFSFTPFNEPGEKVTGETYAFGGYRIKNDSNV